jgi:hypothetical protein
MRKRVWGEGSDRAIRESGYECERATLAGGVRMCERYRRRQRHCWLPLVYKIIKSPVKARMFLQFPNVPTRLNFYRCRFFGVRGKKKRCFGILACRLFYKILRVIRLHFEKKTSCIECNIFLPW